MKLNSAIENIEKSDVFVSWKKSHPKCHLAHIFIMADSNFQAGYFNPDTSQITSFQCDENVSMLPPSPVFQDEETEILSLELDNVKISYDSAIEKAKSFQESEYPSEKPIKSFVILQHLPIGVVYNISFISQSFKTLNVKIDAANGKMIRHSLDKLIDVVK